MSVRVRFAPSPTGYLHIGGLRTALYNYVFAKQQQGSMYLRIEDTDTTRKVDDAIVQILEGLRWAGIAYDEGPDIGGASGPYIQTERAPRHREVAHMLVEKGHAYYCFCTKEDLDEMRKMQELRGLPPHYDRRYRDFDPEEAIRKVAAGATYTIRLRMPLDGDMICDDIVRGKVRFPVKDLDDTILLKSDGLPTYHLAAMVDDHDMGTTHILRTEEWLPSMPKHVFLFQAMGWDVPVFGHLPLILNEDRTKLSKRKGAVSVSQYIEMGYLQEGLINFLALLGWTHPEEKDVFTMEEMIQVFDLGKVHKAGAVFKLDKLGWINAQHMRRKSPQELCASILAHGEQFGHITKVGDQIQVASLGNHTIDLETFGKIVTHSQSKLTTLVDIWTMMDWYPRQMPHDVSLYSNDKMHVDRAIARNSLTMLHELIADMTPDAFTLEPLKERIFAQISKLGLKNGQVLWPMRAALTGLPSSPGAFEVAEILGQTETLARLTSSITMLQE